jgi:pentose-5-phosphate-3-epimerase
MRARIAPSIRSADFSRLGQEVEAGRDIWLEIDGGVEVENIAEIARAGADTFVTGSAISGGKGYADTIARMRAAIGEARADACRAEA